MKGDTALILTYLDSQMAIFYFLTIFRGRIGVKVGQKTETLSTSPASVKIRVFQNTLDSICATMRTTCG